jgi:hypothetical protein
MATAALLLTATIGTAAVPKNVLFVAGALLVLTVPLPPAC